MEHENFAKYLPAFPVSKKQAAQLTSSNSICGDKFSLKIDTKKQQIKIYNKFNFCVAEIKGENAKQIILWHNKGMSTIALLSYVAYCEPKNSHFAEFFIIAYPKKHAQSYENFIETVSSKLNDGNRPDIKLDEFERKEIENNHGNYKIAKFLPKPKLDKGTVILKNKQGLMEKIIEAGRHKKIGCYFGSILFLVLVIGLIILLISQVIS